MFKQCGGGVHSYNVMFQVTHRDADLSGVGVRLGLPVNYAGNKGDPEGHGRCQWSGCNMPIDVQNAKNLPHALRIVVEKLKPHADYLNELWDRQTKLLLFVSVGVVETYICELLDWTLLKELSNLRVSVELTVCGPEADS